MDNRIGPAQNTAGSIFNRNFVLGFLAFFTHLFAAFALIPTLPIYLARLNTNESEIGILVGIFGFAGLASRFFAGAALSQCSEKKVMIFSALLFTVTLPACIMFRPFWPFLILRLVQGVACAFFDTAAFALIIKLSSPEHRGRILGYFMLAPGLATAMAPSSGMFIVNQFSFPALFLICTAVSLSALLFVGVLRKPEMTWSDNKMEGKNIFALERKIIVPAMNGCLFNFVLGSIATFFPLYAIQCGVSNPGYFFSAAALMTITGRLLGGKVQDMWTKEKIILVFTFSSMISMVMLSFSHTLPSFLLVGLIWGTGVAFIFPVSMAYGIEYAASSGGAAVGTFRAITDLGMALGPMIMGLVVPFTGYPSLFLCLALTCLVSLSYFQFYVRRKRDPTLAGKR
jgi:MFS family permease